MSVFLIATLDTKGHEAAFVRDRLQSLGLEVTVVDAGCLAEPAFAAEVPRETVFAAAGSSLEAIQQAGDRGLAVSTAATGASQVVQEAWQKGELDGVIGLGGSAGTIICTTAMRELPIGVPKLAVSTLASGDVRPYVGEKDVMMLNSIVDIAGINRISRRILDNAALAMAGMVRDASTESQSADRPLVAATMFGVTTPCVERARQVLEEAGYEVLVFHATGAGGRCLESLARDRWLAGVLDITTMELADELVGGVLTAGPERLTAAAEMGVPQVVSVGATDMVNFGTPESVPERFQGRTFYQHNPAITLMRTTTAECAQLGEEIGRKVAASSGPATIMLPLRGVSAIDRDGQPFDDNEARGAAFAAIRAHHGGARLVEMDHHINDSEFAEAAARELLTMMASVKKTTN